MSLNRDATCHSQANVLVLLRGRGAGFYYVFIERCLEYEDDV